MRLFIPFAIAFFLVGVYVVWMRRPLEPSPPLAASPVSPTPQDKPLAGESAPDMGLVAKEAAVKAKAAALPKPESLPPRAKVDLAEQTKLFESPDVAVRRAVIERVGATQDPAAIGLLRKAAGDPQPSVRTAALDSLIVMRNDAVVPAAREIIAERFTDQDLEVRLTAYTSSATVVDDAMVDRLIVALQRTESVDEAEVILLALDSRRSPAVPKVREAQAACPKPIQAAVAQWLGSK